MFKKYFNKLKQKIVNHHGFMTEKGQLFSYSRWHAWGLGFMDGMNHPFTDVLERQPLWREEHEDVEKHSHYFTKGFFKGQKVSIGLMVLLAVAVIAFNIYIAARMKLF